jgi:hypothetical protein
MELPVQGMRPESARRAKLIGLITASIGRERRRASGCHTTGMLLLILAVCASGGAGIIAIATDINRQIIGAIALIPAFFALLATTIKFDERAMFHYKKKRDLEALLNRLEFELPAEATDDQIATISTSLTKIGKQYDIEFERKFSANWSFVKKKI